MKLVASEGQYAQSIEIFGRNGPALGFGLGWGAYVVATWEKDVDIAFAQDAIDEYKAREATAAIQGKMVGMQHKKSKANLKKLDEQPGWLNGGQLRDYQLEGLNILVNS